MTRSPQRTRAPRARAEKAGPQEPAQAIRTFFATLQTLGARPAATPPPVREGRRK